MCRQSRFKLRLVKLQAVFFQNILRQIQRETVGVIKLERIVAGENCRAGFLQLFNDVADHVQAVADGFAEFFFFHQHNLGDKFALFADFRVCVAHQLANQRHHLVHERLGDVERYAITHGAAENAAQHVIAPVIAGDNAVCNQECAGANVVGNNAVREARLAGVVGRAGQIFNKSNKLAHNRDFIVAIHALHNGGDTFQAHAGVNAGSGQRGQRAAFIAFILHEHQIPNFHPAVAVAHAHCTFGRITGVFFAAVKENFGARTARAGFTHRPEIVLFAHAVNAGIVKAGNAFPNFARFVIILVNRHIEAVFRELQNLGDKFPSVLDGVLLEIIAKGEVAQHFKKSMVASRAPNRIKVVVLAAGAHAFLRRGRSGVGALFQPKEGVLKLHHACVYEEQGRVVVRHKRRACNSCVPLRLEEFEKGLTNLSLCGIFAVMRCFRHFILQPSLYM